MKKKQFELLLYRSFDGMISEKESEALKAALENSAEYRTLYREAELIRNAVSKSAEPDFYLAFEERVIEKITGQAAVSGFWDVLFISLPKSFRNVAYAGAFALAALVVYNVTEGNSLVINTVLGKHTTTIEAAFDPTTQSFWNTTR